MRTGKSLTDLAQEIERQATTKKDYVAETTALEMVAFAGAPGTAEPGGVQLQLEGNGALGVNSVAHRQIGEHVGVPAKYYDRMLAEAPALLAGNVNHWLHDRPARRMVRTLDGNARAFLSDKYRPLENFEVCEAALPHLLEMKVEIVSCEITEQRLYIKAVDARVVEKIGTTRVVNGRLVNFDDVCPSLIISNSEVGMGALSVEIGMFTHACKNMAIFRESSLRKYHVGARAELAEAVQVMLSDRTKRITDAAIWSQVGDVVRGAFNPALFKNRIDEQVAPMVAQKITGKIEKVVEVTTKHLNLGDAGRQSILRNLIEGADLSRYGLFNAITRAAEEVEDYDEATRFERAGGAVIELAANDWKRIAEAA